MKAGGPALGALATLVCLVVLSSLGNLVRVANGAQSAAPACRISEYPCRSGQCVRLDRYCDGVDDCGDNSDEPRFCTVCNRTYYGDVGKTYELKLGKPIESRLPFLCHLTFTANGHMHGDIVQLIFDAFNVGRYEPTALDGCPDGYMQLSELGRPFTGGSWCGSSSGYAVYYSETSTITVSVKLFHFRTNTPFEFKLRYKFVSQMEAIVRFGAPSSPLERGQVSPGTYCTRNYEECYRKPCRLQSPNYPGMYPRNVTCYWSLRQKTVPTCKHAMIAVRQEAEHKMQMKRSISMASLNKTNRALRAWKECTGEKDHLIFYDGGSTNDPVLVKYCGGDWLPRVVSRGPEMLVAFHSSPFSIPLHSSTATSPLRGFELDVDIIFTDSDSLDYSREARRCEFHIHASSGTVATVPKATTTDGTKAHVSSEDTTRGRRGRLLSPRHTLPPNTTCQWTFHGRPGITYQWCGRTGKTVASTYTNSIMADTSRELVDICYSSTLDIQQLSLQNVFFDWSTGKTWTTHSSDLIWIYFVSYSHRPLIPQSQSEETTAGTFTPPPFYQGMANRFNLSFGRPSTVRSDRITSKSDYARFLEREREPDKSTNEKHQNITACSTRLRIWDGGGPDDSYPRLLSDNCDDDSPRLCDHTSLSNLTRATRPCTPEESYISTGSKMVIHHHTLEGTALHPSTFKLKYEFVDTRLGGDSWSGGGLLKMEAMETMSAAQILATASTPTPSPSRPGTGPCARVFRKMSEGDVNSPRNVFLYGRGGALNMSCAYRIEANSGERIRLTIKNVSMGSTCFNEQDPHTGRPRCNSLPNTRTVSLRIWEAPWKDIRVPRACVCDNSSSSESKPLVITSSSRALELLFTVSQFSITEDYTDLYFYASFEMIPAPECFRKQRLRGSGGEEEVSHPPRTQVETSCAGMPWVIEARDNRSLFLLTWGTLLPLVPNTDEPVRCGTKNRLMIYTGRPPRLIKVVCPSEPNSRQNAIQVFSEDWFSPTSQPTSPTVYLTPPKPPSFLVEFVAREHGIAGFTWLEISRSKSSLLQQLQVSLDTVESVEKMDFGNDTLSAFSADCAYKCPELNACISSSLWCDGRLNCPSGYDENEMHCGVGRRFFKQFPGGVYTALGCTAAVLAACILFTIFALIARIRKGRRRRLGKKKLLATADGRRLTEELLLDPGSNTTTVSS